MSTKNNLKLFDAILVAGEEKASYKVANQYKALLKIEDKYCIYHILETLRQVKSIGRIIVVGPTHKLQSALNESGIDMKAPKPIQIVEQKSHLYQNTWHAFLQSLPEHINEENLVSSEFYDKAVLIVPCDAPLMTPHEVEYFIANCDLEQYDYILGLTPEKSMQYFYPREDQPGIKMAYLHLKEGNFRINNMHMVKPARVKNREHINKMYAYRYQKNVVNMILLGLYLIGIEGLKNYKMLAGLQLALMAAKLNLDWLKNYFSRWVPKKEIERAISNILNTRLASLVVPYPGAALDIDNDRDYESLKMQYRKWREYLNTLHEI